MPALIRLIYASRSTSPAEGQFQGLDLGVARILAKSRKNNQQLGIVGGLLFGDGCFLQCLEGEEGAVSRLYDKIKSDQRHRDVTELSRTPIAARTFGDWSMKYVPGEQALGELMRGWGFVRFDPYALSPEQLDAATVYLRQQADLARQLPDEQAASAPATAPKSYIGKNVPLPWEVKPDASSDKPEPVATDHTLGWLLGSAVVVLLAIALYLATR
jgi:hypothetical protein